MSQPECEAACASEGGSVLCISSLEENDAVYSAFVEPGKCEDALTDSCVWLGLTNSVDDRNDQKGMRYHWDRWSNGCGSAYRDWDRSQPNGGISYYAFEDQNCVVMGFYQRPQWWDVNCTRYQAKCVCEVNGDYPAAQHAGGGISGFGVFMLMLVFGFMCATRLIEQAALPGRRSPPPSQTLLYLSLSRTPHTRAA